MLKNLLTTLALLIMPLSLAAQGNFISVSMIEDSKEMNTGGMFVVRVISNLDDIYFACNIDNLHLDQQRSAANDKGEYTYVVGAIVTPEFDGKTVKFSVQRKGEVDRSFFPPKLLKADRMCTFRVVQPERRMKIYQQEGAMSNGEKNIGSLELISSTRDVFLKGAEELKIKRMSTTPLEGGTYKVVYHFDLAPMFAARNALTQSDGATEYAALCKKFELLDENPQAMTDAEIVRHEELEKEVIPRLHDELARLSYVVLSTEKSNEEVIDISDFSSAENRCYGVKVESAKEVTGYTAILEQARLAYTERNYKEAKVFYEQAATYPGAPSDAKEVCQQRIERMQLLADHDNYARTALGMIIKAQKEGKKLPAEDIEKYFGIALDSYNVLYTNTKDEFYLQRVQLCEKNLAKIGFVIEGKITRSDFRQGQLHETPLPNVKIYGITHYVSEKDVRYSTLGDLLGTADAQGNYHIQLERGKYKMLLFAPSNNEFKRNYLITIDKETHTTKNVRIKG